jgi:hypothetical protein
MGPPYTSASETVLDLVEAAETLDDACAWVTRAVQQGVKVPMLRDAMKYCGRMRWRREIEELFAAATAGCPRPPGRRDRVYEQFRVVVELDGKLFHRDKRKDQRRDNAATASGLHPLRYGWSDVRHRACLTADEVARTLREHGWNGRPWPCSAGCQVGAAQQP